MVFHPALVNKLSLLHSNLQFIILTRKFFVFFSEGFFLGWGALEGLSRDAIDIFSITFFINTILTLIQFLSNWCNGLLMYSLSWIFFFKTYGIFCFSFGQARTPAFLRAFSIETKYLDSNLFWVCGIIFFFLDFVKIKLVVQEDLRLNFNAKVNSHFPIF